MPRLIGADRFSRSISADDDMDDIPASIPPTQTAEEQLTQQLAEATSATSAATKVKGTRAQKNKQVKLPVNGKEDKAEGNGEEDADEDEYVVEKIIDHTFKGKKCLYRVRWEGWSAQDDTWEPEEHLLPESKEALAEYHQKLGGAPQPPKQVRKTASKANIKEEAPTEDDGEEPPSKRAKRGHRSTSNAVLEPGSKEWKDQPLGAWQPADKGSWEDLVHEVETVERDENDNLYAYIRFRNGKRSKVANNLYTARCPRAMLRFYEGHLSV